MIKDFFNNPLQKYEQSRLELQEQSEQSPTSRNSSFLDQSVQFLPVRIHKFNSFPHQKHALIKSLLPAHYLEELSSLPNPQYLKVKNTRDRFYGQTTVFETSGSHTRHNIKVAHGLGEIFFENGAYLIGYFDHGILEQEFVFVLENGSYIRAKPINKKPKRSLSGFITDDSDELASQDNSSQEDKISQSDIHLHISDQPHKNIFSNLQCEINFNGTYYKGALKKGQLNGFVREQGKDYQFQGHFIDGQRKRGKITSIHGFSYEGTFKHNKFDGLGTLTTSDGVYSGEFKNGLKEGQGDFTWNDGSSYKGDFKKDQKHGKGFFKSKEGSFKGEWKNDQIQGAGYLVIGNQGVGGTWKKNSYEKPNKFF